jgi:CRP-like cAMP-binding protein
MARQLARQFTVFSDRIDNLEYKKSGERLAYRLLFLASRFGVRRNNRTVIDLPITHEVLAGTINLARESVSREMEKLERRGIISRINHQIIINNMVALRETLSQPLNMQQAELHTQQKYLPA